MKSVELTNEAWSWVTELLEWNIGRTGNLNAEEYEAERQVFRAIRDQLDSNGKCEPPTRPPLDEAILESLLDRMAEVIGHCNWTLKSYGLSPEGKDSIVRVRQGLADALKVIGSTRKWVQGE